MKSATVVFLAAVLGALAVILGAFGAHGLESRLDARALEVYHTAVTYHVYHALALLALGLSGAPLAQSVYGRAAAWCWLLGIAVFSGSLYALALSGVTVLGAITPIGGVLFIVGWSALALGAWRSRNA